MSKLKNLKDDAALVAAQNKLAELQAKRAELEQRQRQAESATGDKPSRLDIEARRLLGDEQAVADDDPQTSIREELHIVDRALELQRGVVARERSRVSTAIAESCLPAHKANVKAIAKALQDLRAAAFKEEALRDELYQADVAFAGIIRPMGITTGAPIRTAAELSELVDAYCKEATAYGLI